MTDFELGRHAAQIQGLEDRTERIEQKMDTVLEILAERKGERRTVAYIASAAGALASLLITALLKIWHPA